MIATAVAAPLRGVIEGFYGVSWPDEVRGLYAAWLAELGLNCYLYAPKSDRYLRRAWTEPWPDDEGKRLRVLSDSIGWPGSFLASVCRPSLYIRITATSSATS